MNDQEFITLSNQESEELISASVDPTPEQARANLFQVLKTMFFEQYKRDLTPEEEKKLEIIFNAQIQMMQPQKSRKLTASDLVEFGRAFQCRSESGGNHPSPNELVMPTQESVDLYYQKYGTKDDPYPKFVCKPIELETNAAQDGFERNCEEQVKRIHETLFKKETED